jgi:hypothetical protein
MTSASLTDVRIAPVDDRPGAERLFLVSDTSGVLALIESGAAHDDELLRSDGLELIDPPFYTVAWSRSRTIVDGGLQSSDLAALGHAVAEWELDVDGRRRDLFDDHRRAVERAELACSELDRLDAGGHPADPALRGAAEQRVRHALADRARLGESLRLEAEAFAARVSLPGPRTRSSRSRRHRSGSICRQTVLDEAITELARSGVVVTVQPELISAVARKLGLPRYEIEALWMSSADMRGDILLTLAREGLASKAADAALISTWNFLTAHVSLLTTAEGRRSLLGQLIALIAQHEVEAVTSSMSWRNHIVCSIGLAETSRLSATLSEQLKASEEEHLRRMSGFYENLLDRIGFRLVGRLRQNHYGFAAALASVIEGLGVVRRTMPAATSASYGDARDPDLTLASLLLTTVLDGLLEEDPEYDVERAVLQLTHGVEFGTEVL